MSQLSLSELTIENIGIWPKPYKLGAIALLVVVIFALAYFLSFKSQFEQWQLLIDKERTLKEQLEIKQKRAASLPLYKKQLANMQVKFGTLLKQLPSKSEIPSLLEDISNLGVQSGLKFVLFDPEEEQTHDFYIELPIKMEVLGNYHQIAFFVSKVANLDRIVTLHDLKINIPTQTGTNKEPEMTEGGVKLSMEIIARIYRYQGFPIT